jgi:hypothetical protein
MGVKVNGNGGGKENRKVLPSTLMKTTSCKLGYFAHIFLDDITQIWLLCNMPSMYLEAIFTSST